ncbi:zinc-dependent alcohol dehydrogenase [Garicola koreensis]|uniref:Threonine dehydrogenase-like Zn-dependent dehydrogenase n=1 Tax=Garicola koreensis TaxID=1262554 RepID=A0A7W5Y0S4_9MICC|nr:zinc-binding alcohol dehydrogenase [Garicola koreensis]MBB3667493.1 threonine dehydrogenase-like Zn-dependent dehydrogenase [Garicola koreensis]
MITTPDAARAREYWTQSAFNGRVREVPVPVPGPGEVLIETELSGISPGTEALIHRGDVPDSVAELMRAPQQLGDLPFPVSHGYLNVGTVRQGPAELRGRRVFTLAGHRSHVVVPAGACHLVGEAVPTERALLAGVAEVGLNALWEAPVTLGDRIAVIGGGLVGLVTALLVQGVSPARLQLIEVDADRARLAADMGLHAVSPEEAAADNDVVLHASASAEGLRRALEITGDDGSVVELSWYGTRSPQVPLGADFHARRLRLLGTQVGQVAAPKRLRRSRTQRLAAALNLLDARFDALVTGRSPVERLPEVMDDFASGAAWTRNQLLHVVTYEGDK